MPDAETRRILTRAAEMVERGWCQHVGALDANGKHISTTFAWAEPERWDLVPARVCLTEAIYRAVYAETGERPEQHDVPQIRRCARALLRVKPELRGTGGPSWNNAPERTQAEVVALLRAAAERSEATP